MQDKAIAQIGHWQLEKNKDLEPVDLYIENMFPGKDWQILLLVFEIITLNGKYICNFKRIDIEKVGKESESYRKYAYRKGSSRAGDITFTTKLGLPIDKKIKNIKEAQFNKIFSVQNNESEIFKIIGKSFSENEKTIIEHVNDSFSKFTKEELTTTGISIKIVKENEELFLRGFEIICNNIIEAGTEGKSEHNGTISKNKNGFCSVTGEKEENILGFAAPFKYSSPDKPGFISGFFKKKKFWRNYPISSKEALALEYGKKFIQQHLTGYFYGHEYLFVPHPVIKTDNNKLNDIVNLLQTFLQAENSERQSKEKKKRAEDRVQKLIAQENNYFYLDMLFYKEDKTTKAINISLMLEEILPSRFKKLFIDVPEKVNINPLFKNAIIIKKEEQDLLFSFQIVKNLFEKSFLDVVQRIFLGKPLSKTFLFEKIIKLIQKNHNERKTQDKWTEPASWTVLKAIMLINYLQELNIIENNKTYKYMEIEPVEKKEGRFNLSGFNEFVKSNQGFLDTDIKVGVFGVGVLVRFLFDIQQANIHNTPFENKLRGYKLNPELLTSIYMEALDKIQKYQKNFYVYSDLKEIINNYFTIKKHEINSLSNNELSFYFVAGLEFGRKFKNEKEINNIL